MTPQWDFSGGFFDSHRQGGGSGREIILVGGGGGGGNGIDVSKWISSYADDWGSLIDPDGSGCCQPFLQRDIRGREGGREENQGLRTPGATAVKRNTSTRGLFSAPYGSPSSPTRRRPSPPSTARLNAILNGRTWILWPLRSPPPPPPPPPPPFFKAIGNTGVCPVAR